VIEGAWRSAGQQELSRRANSGSSVRIKTLAFFKCPGSRKSSAVSEKRAL
jgi:hypothetical protein